MKCEAEHRVLNFASDAQPVPEASAPLELNYEGRSHPLSETIGTLPVRLPPWESAAVGLCPEHKSARLGPEARTA